MNVLLYKGESVYHPNPCHCSEVYESIKDYASWQGRWVCRACGLDIAKCRSSEPIIIYHARIAPGNTAIEVNTNEQQELDRRYAKLVQSNKLMFLIALIVIVLIAVLTSGCGTMSTYEKSWQLTHAIDYGQTLHIARSPTCYGEGNFLTKRLVGNHPSESEVTAVMATYALAHYGINRWLEEKAENEGTRGWHATLRFFQASTTLLSARTIVRNHGIGLRPFDGGSTCAPAPDPPRHDPGARPIK